MTRLKVELSDTALIRRRETCSSNFQKRNMKRSEIRKLMRRENDLSQNGGEKNDSSEIETARSLGGGKYARRLC